MNIRKTGMSINSLAVVDNQIKTATKKITQEDTNWVTVDVSYKDLTPDPTEEDGYYDECEESQFD